MRPPPDEWGADAVAALAELQPGNAALCCALPGGGKSRIAQAASAYWPRRVVFDPTAARGRANWARGDRDRWPWPGRLVTVRELLTRPSLLDWSPLSLVVQPSASFGEDLIAREFAAVARLCWLTGGGIVLVAEELGLYGRGAPDALVMVTAAGAHGGLAAVLVCQSMGRVPKDGRRHLSMVVAGPQAETTDLDDLSGRCGQEFSRRVAALQPGDAPIVWTPGSQFRKAAAT